MEAEIVGEFGVEGCSKAVSLFDSDDLIVVVGENFCAGTGLRHDGGTNEYSGDGFFDAFHFDFVFKAVDLGAESVAADFDVEEIKAILVAALDGAGHEDHSHTGPPDGHSLLAFGNDRVTESIALHEEADRGAFSTGKDEAVDVFELFGRTDFFGDDLRIA